MKKKVKSIPHFQSEDEEREFWQTHDTTEYFDFSQKARKTIEFDSSVEAPVRMISLRLPREMLNDLKVLANKKDVPYQSLIKVFLGEKISQEKQWQQSYGSHRPI